MRTFDRCAAQGELYFERIDTLPDGVRAVAPDGDRYIIGHSETGHHHVLERTRGRVFALPDEILECFIVVDGDALAEIKHLRPYDTHETIGLSKGAYRVRRRREYVPEGFRRVAD
jgi:hypothetical protein